MSETKIPSQTKIKLEILISEAKPKRIPQEHKQPSLLEKVRSYVDCVESAEESAKEWYYLQRLYEKLQTVKKLTPEQEQIVYWIEPLMLKYGHGDPHNAVKYDGAKMLRGKDHEGE